MSIKREDMIQSLKEISPVITQVTFSDDMGFEFSAVVDGGLIYAEPGMLLHFSGGQWPPSLWGDKTDEEYNDLFYRFLLDETWEVTQWEDLSDKEIKQWYENACLHKGDEEIE